MSELSDCHVEIRRLTAANLRWQEQAEEQKQRIKRLEKAGDLLKNRYILENENWDLKTVNDWNEAKDIK